MMGKKSVSDILKTAILLERNSNIFYSTVAKQTSIEAVREIFLMLAEEEKDHIDFLSQQYAYYEKNNSFLQNKFIEKPNNTDITQILTPKIKNQIMAASFEAAAISAAIDFENRSIEIYSNRSKTSSDPYEKKMYQTLADWEKTHHRFLHRLNEDLKEKIWNDNKFWPF